MVKVQVTGHRSQFAVHSHSLQFAVTSGLQDMQVKAVASQMLSLKGNECLILVKVQKGLYTKVYDYSLSDPEHVRDILLNLPTSPCIS